MTNSRRICQPERPRADATTILLLPEMLTSATKTNRKLHVNKTSTKQEMKTRCEIVAGTKTEGGEIVESVFLFFRHPIYLFFI